MTNFIVLFHISTNHLSLINKDFLSLEDLCDVFEENNMNINDNAIHMLHWNNNNMINDMLRILKLIIFDKQFN